MLTLNHYPASPATAPYIRRYYVMRVDLSSDACIIDNMIAETAFVRFGLLGNWAIKNAAGDWQANTEPHLFGGGTKPVSVKVEGSFVITGFGIQPAAWKALNQTSAAPFTDKMVPLKQVWGGDIVDEMMGKLHSGLDDHEILAVIDAAIIARLAAVGTYTRDEKVAHFEAISRIDSVVRMDDAAQEIGISVRQLERRCLESFGMTPKTILRRSRFLDMAMAMRGFSTPNAEELSAMRYFDQSHLNREFRRFVGMTPGAFQKAYTPMMTAGLQLRSLGKELFTDIRSGGQK